MHGNKIEIWSDSAHRGHKFSMEFYGTYSFDVQQKKRQLYVGESFIQSAVLAFWLNESRDADWLLNEGIRYCQASIDHNERMPNSNRHFDRAELANAIVAAKWLLTGDDDVSMKRLSGTEVEAYINTEKDPDLETLSYFAANLLDSDDVERMRRLYNSLGGNEDSLLPSKAKHPVQVALVIHDHILKGAFAQLEVSQMLQKALSRLIHRYINGSYLKAAHWLKLAYWKYESPNDRIPPRDVLLMAYRHAKGAIIPEFAKRVVDSTHHFRFDKLPTKAKRKNKCDSERTSSDAVTVIVSLCELERFRMWNHCPTPAGSSVTTLLALNDDGQSASLNENQRSLIAWLEANQSKASECLQNAIESHYKRNRDKYETNLRNEMGEGFDESREDVLPSMRNVARIHELFVVNGAWLHVSQPKIAFSIDHEWLDDGRILIEMEVRKGEHGGLSEEVTELISSYETDDCKAPW